MTGQVLNLQEQKREFTRQRLMDAAAEVFDRKDYHLCKIEDIALAAGCSRATFYLHYKSKADLVVNYLERNLPDAIRRYSELDAMLTSPKGLSRTQLRHWLGEWKEVWGLLNSSGGSGILHAMMLAQIMEPEVDACKRAQSSAFIDALSGFFASVPRRQRENLRARALILESMSQAVFAAATDRRLPASDEQYLDYLTDLWADLYIR